jgi:hypothetical protein
MAEARGLDAERGCTVVSVTIVAAMVGYMIYWFASGGDPEVKKFRDDCYDRFLRKYHYNPTDDQKTQNILQCDKEIKEFLRRRRAAQ